MSAFFRHRRLILDGLWLTGMSKGDADEVTKHDEFIFGLAQKRMSPS
jgi:hypothetical protein